MKTKQKNKKSRHNPRKNAMGLPRDPSPPIRKRVSQGAGVNDTSVIEVCIIPATVLVFFKDLKKKKNYNRFFGEEILFLVIVCFKAFLRS